MGVLDVNNDGLIALTAKLERMHRSAFPSAVRNTLNAAAFETKKNVPKVAAQKFTTRQKSFFKAFTIVDKASGFDIASMKATTGIDESKGSKVAKGLEAQENGGNVKGGKLIAHDHARTSKNQGKKVAQRNKHSRVKFHDATNAYRAHRGTKKSKFISAVLSTAKSGQNYMMLKTGSRGMVYQISGVTQKRNSRNFNVKIKKLYSVRNRKTSRVQGVHFMRNSAKLASRKIDKFYKEAAEFQFNKALRK